MKMRKNIVSVLAMLLVLLLTVGSFGAAFAEASTTTKPLSELTQEDIDYLRSLLVTEDGPLMGEELLAHIQSFEGEELYWTLAAVSDEQYASLQEILTEDELIALFAPLQERVYVAPTDFTRVAPLVDFGTASYALRAADTGDGNQSETEGLFLKKTATFDPATYTGKITMEAYVEGSVSTTTTIKPCDIVLVLDVSGSMEEKFTTLKEVYSLSNDETYYTADGEEIRYYSSRPKGMDRDDWDGAGWYVEGWRSYNKVTAKTSADDVNGIQFYEEAAGSGTRLAALQYSANDFIAQIAYNARDKKVDHRVAIVKFAGADGYQQSEIVQPLVSAGTNEDSLTSAINNLDSNGATRADEGMEYAESIISGTKVNDKVPEDRIRVVVMFTDGEPNDWNGFDDYVANGAVSSAYTLKNTLDTTVYTIGIFSGADPEEDDRANNYMNAVSSNFPYATAYTNLGDGDRTAGYYLAASNASSLNNIFDKIANKIASGSASIKLDETTVITDTINPTFELPEGTDASDIKVYTQASTEEGVWADRVDFEDAIVTVNGSTVTVSNFNFQENYVGEHVQSDGTTKEWSGKKLIIEIPFEPTDDYFGGNTLDTNTTATISNTAADFTEEFDNPTVDVPLRYEIAAQDQAIYLSNLADLSTIMQYVTDAESSFVSDGGTVNYTPNGTNNADVDIVYTLKDSSGAAVATLTIDAGETPDGNDWVWAKNEDDEPLGPNRLEEDDTAYTVECTVTAVTQVEGGTNNSLAVGPETGNVYVYKPQVTANDKTVDYGAVVTLADQVVGDVAWVHPQDATIGHLLDTDTKPSTVLTFKVNDTTATTATVTAETPVEITLGLNDPSATFDFMPYTTFIRNATECGFDACDAKTTTEHLGNETACEFVLHLGTINLYVDKNVTGNMADVTKKFGFTAKLYDSDKKQIGEAITFELSHSDAPYKLENMPIGATLEIVEANDGYTTTYTSTTGESGDGATYTDTLVAADNEETTALNENDANKVITFNNHKEAEIETGISLDSLPYILLLAVVLTGVMFFVARRKRSED